jgi:hypothetical protein
MNFLVHENLFRLFGFHFIVTWLFFSQKQTLIFDFWKNASHKTKFCIFLEGVASDNELTNFDLFFDRLYPDIVKLFHIYHKKRACFGMCKNTKDAAMQPKVGFVSSWNWSHDPLWPKKLKLQGESLQILLRDRRKKKKKENQNLHIRKGVKTLKKFQELRF